MQDICALPPKILIWNVVQEMMNTQEYNLFSVMGPHAGEDSDTIFARKIADIHNEGRTFWVIRSHKAKPDMIQTIGANFCGMPGAPLCAFLASFQGGAAADDRLRRMASL